MRVEFLVGQYEAALSTLNYCIGACPDAEWQAEHGDAPFSQVVFHALFYADFLLDSSLESFKRQPFHEAHAATFGDYEELEDRLPERLYEKAFCREYLRHCLAKARAYFDGMEEADWYTKSPQRASLGSKLEVYAYALRHIQHHAAQLGLRIQLATKQETPWFGSGWKE